MKVICSWCTSEGRIGLVREKAPFADARETHGICARHFHKLGADRDPLVSSDGDSSFPLHDAASFRRNLSAAGLL